MFFLLTCKNFILLRDFYPLQKGQNVKRLFAKCIEYQVKKSVWLQLSSVLNFSQFYSIYIFLVKESTKFTKAEIIKHLTRKQASKQKKKTLVLYLTENVEILQEKRKRKNKQEMFPNSSVPEL